MTENNTITCEKFLPHPPAAVWKALTDPDLHARWWAAGDIKPVAGHRFTLDMGTFGSQPCEVTEVDDQRLLAYRFAEGSLDTTITWTLHPEGEGTRLVLTHAGFDLDSAIGRQAYAGMGKGWPHVLNRLDSTLAETA
ncbi:SRPBCC domain-containing protein [Streptomyces griseoluteus]|uniref:SRPBCC domain-containing protein n=1 Tax=Streptomyces griseoluteus TaxID=29306 RepID=A0A4Z1CYI9_STRGP|nr:SRPBCC domain-containing protein [Streptomyces griseoluteus]TGN74420.1 SRPBCC domain-containing protein [Streptomyces griseoluteus]